MVFPAIVEDSDNKPDAYTLALALDQRINGGPSIFRAQLNKDAQSIRFLFIVSPSLVFVSGCKWMKQAALAASCQSQVRCSFFAPCFMHVIVEKCMGNTMPALVRTLSQMVYIFQESRVQTRLQL